MLQLRSSLSFFLVISHSTVFFCHLGHFFGDSSFLVLILDGESVIGLIYVREYLYENLMVNEKTWFLVCRFSHKPIQWCFWYNLVQSVTICDIWATACGTFRNIFTVAVRIWCCTEAGSSLDATAVIIMFWDRSSGCPYVDICRIWYMLTCRYVLYIYIHV